jgi:hypothetical protein
MTNEWQQSPCRRAIASTADLARDGEELSS